MGNLYRRPDSSDWWCWYRDARGKLKRESTEETDEMKARRFLSRRERDAGAGKSVGPDVDKVEVGDIADLYLKKMAGTSWHPTLNTIVARIVDYFGAYRAIEVNVAVLTNFVAWLKTHYRISDQTVNRHLAALRSMYNLAQDHEMINYTPRVKVLMRPESPARQVYFTKQQFIAFHEALAPQYRGFVSFLYRTGMRIGQAGKIELRDVHLDQGIIECRPETTKNGSPYLLPLVGAIREIVEAAWASRRLDCPYLFHVEGRPMMYEDRSRSTPLRKAWTAAQQATGLTHLHPHDLRRSATRNLLAAGNQIKDAQLVTGHRDSAMIDRYNTRDVDDAAAAILVTERWVDEQPTDSTVIPMGGKK